MDYLSKIKLGDTTYALKDAEAREAIEAVQSAIASSLVFKGVVSNAVGITGLANYTTGEIYKAISAFTITGLGKIEPGDMIVAVNSNTSFNADDWAVIQGNVDNFNGATSSANGTKGLVPAPSAGDENKVLYGNGTWGAAIIWGTY